MTESIALLIAAALAVLLIVIMPKVVCFRIGVLRFLRLNRLADWTQKHFQFFVHLLRVITVGILCVLLYLIYTGW